jgi:hypothetical protein
MLEAAFHFQREALISKSTFLISKARSPHMLSGGGAFEITPATHLQSISDFEITGGQTFKADP